MKINKKCIMALASFVLLLLQSFGLKFDVPVVNELISAAASVLVMLGIVSDSGAGTANGDKPDNKNDDKNENSEKTGDSDEESNARLQGVAEEPSVGIEDGEDKRD